MGDHPQIGGRIGSNEALNLDPLDWGDVDSNCLWKKMTKREREAALHKFTQDGWLTNAPGSLGQYSIGVGGCVSNVPKYNEVHRVLWSIVNCTMYNSQTEPMFNDLGSVHPSPKLCML